MKGTGRYKLNLIMALLIAFGSLAAVLLSDASPKLGLDLEGGTSVILTAKSGEGTIEKDVLDQTVEIIRQRIDALGVAEPEVSAAGSDTILVQLPGVEDEKRALEIIGGTAQLSFRQVLEVFNAKQPAATPTPTATPSPTGKKGVGKKGDPSPTPTPTPTSTPDIPEVTTIKDSSVNDEEVVYPDADNPDLLYRLAPAGVLSGDVLTKAEAVLDSAGTNWVVTLEMDKEGAAAWAELTSKLACLRDKGEQVKDQVAIVLDGKVETATGMAQPGGGSSSGVVCGTGITGGSSQIDVQEEQEAKDLALVLRTGALPLTLEQSSVSKVSATLGKDSLKAGLTAGAMGLGLVMLYVLLYYRGLGLIVWSGLAVFTAAMYSILSMLGKTSGLSLTLAGIAGIIVSIGITTDSYIVAFERLKDEIHSGRTMRSAVDRGMVRAFRTILVADFVTGAAAIILFFLAVGPVKGFALTLGLATLVDVLIAYFFTRPMVVLLARTKRFTEGRFIGIKYALGVKQA